MRRPPESCSKLTTSDRNSSVQPVFWKRLPSVLAQAVAATAFSAMFIAFIVQVFTRYVLDAPLAWTSEVCSIAYLWIAFWGGGLIVSRKDQVRFDLIYQYAAPPRQRVMAILGAVILLAVFLRAFPSNLDFVRFMGYDRTWVLELPFDRVFFVFLVFLAGMIVQAFLRIIRLSRKDWRKAVSSSGS